MIVDIALSIYLVSGISFKHDLLYAIAVIKRIAKGIL